MIEVIPEKPKEELQDPNKMWVDVTIRMTKAEEQKLQALAKGRTERHEKKKKFTPTSCIRDFIQSCMPDGGGWEHPEKAAKKFEAEKKVMEQCLDALDKQNLAPSNPPTG